MEEQSKIKAIALMSGGLDSTLAAKLVADQGIEVVGLHLSSPFACRSEVEKNSAAIGVPLIIKEKGEAYLELIENPKYGYGKNMNPCIDCRIFMFEFATRTMIEESAQFIVTGEVLGQRPMSQRREAMHVIDRDSLTEGRILRPLSAHRFAPTIAEEKGWVDREKLLGISGRSRKDQYRLAKELGVSEYEAPGGGCLLTQADYSRRLRDFLDTDDDKSLHSARSQVLRYGRHFRLSDKLRVIVGRNEAENEVLRQNEGPTHGTFFEAIDFSGPSALAFGNLNEGLKKRVGELIARYGKPTPTQNLIQYSSANEKGDIRVSKSFTDNELEEARI